MEQITLGQIAMAVTMIAGLITGGTIIFKSLKKMLDSILNEKFNAIDMRLDELNAALEDRKKNACMNYLVVYLNDVANGQAKDEVAVKRFWELYDYYTMHGGNSYIREKVNKLKEKNLL